MSTTNREIATALTNKLWLGVIGMDALTSLRDSITAALEAKDAERIPPKGHMIDDDGTVRKVLTDENHPLPILGDGSMWVLPSYVWTFDNEGQPTEICVEDCNLEWTEGSWTFQYGDGDVPLSDCYSTRAAAEQAAKEAK